MNATNWALALVLTLGWGAAHGAEPNDGAWNWQCNDAGTACHLANHPMDGNGGSTFEGSGGNTWDITAKAADPLYSTVRVKFTCRADQIGHSRFWLGPFHRHNNNRYDMRKNAELLFGASGPMAECPYNIGLGNDSVECHDDGGGRVSQTWRMHVESLVWDDSIDSWYGRALVRVEFGHNDRRSFSTQFTEWAAQCRAIGAFDGQFFLID